MKKLLVLATLLALVSGAVFAETAPAFSGTFEYYVGYDFENEQQAYGMSDNGEAIIAFNAVVDEWTTVDVEFSAAHGAASVGINDFTMTNDITGALGVDGPVSVSVTWGKQTYEPAEYFDVANVNAVGLGSETNAYYGIVLDIGIMEMAHLKTFLMPSTYSDWTSVSDEGTYTDPAFNVELQIMAMDALKFNVYFQRDVPASINEVGFTASYDLGMIQVGAGFEFQMEDTDVLPVINKNAALDLSVAATPIDPLTLGLSFGVGNLLEDAAGDSQFAATSVVKFGAKFDATDAISLYAGVGLANFEDIQFSLDGGVMATLGAVTYTLGYDHNGMGFESNSDYIAQGLYFRVKADF
jgi:hypothetical protein